MHAKQHTDAARETQGGSDWPAIGMQIAAVTIFSGVIAYVATNPQQLAQAVADNHIYTPAPSLPMPSRPAAQAPAPQGEPVRIANPFDASEVFQFPAGTSETDAHLAVASMLLERARDREHLWSHIQPRNKRRASQTPPEETLRAQASTG